jgi:hypothetical protein
MFFAELLIALFFALVFAGVLYALVRPESDSAHATGMDWGWLLFVFLLLFLPIWAGGIWLAPVGPAVFGIQVLGYLVVGLLIALVIAALISFPKRANSQTPEGERLPSERVLARGYSCTGSFFFWVFLTLMILVIFSRYWWWV